MRRSFVSPAKMCSIGLDSLSPELILNIITQLSTPRDLYRLIRTSRYCYHVFASQKAPSLASIIQTAIPPECLSDALAACDASAIQIHAASLPQTSLPLGTDFIRTEEKLRLDALVQAFLDRARESRFCSLRNRMPDFPLLIRLCRLWALVDRFISRYKDDTCGEMDVLLPTGLRAVAGRPSAFAAALSTVEYSRLQRAFFRFEMYRKFQNLGLVNPKCNALRLDYTYWMTRRTWFTCWESEEIACIHTYLIKYVENIYDGLADKLVASVRALCQQCTSRDLVYRATELLLKSDETALLRPFANRGKDNRLLSICDSIATLGLPFLEALPTMAEADQMCVFGAPGDNAPGSMRRFITHLQTTPPTLEQDLPACDDSLAEYNFAWQWVTGRAGRYNGPYEEQYRVLRTLGYVFWDKPRLRDGGFFDLSRRELLEELRGAVLSRPRLSGPLARLKDVFVPLAPFEEKFRDLSHEWGRWVHDGTEYEYDTVVWDSRTGRSRKACEQEWTTRPAVVRRGGAA